MRKIVAYWSQVRIRKPPPAARGCANCERPEPAFLISKQGPGWRQRKPSPAVDLTLCLYSALSHLPVASLTGISTEIARVTSGYFITTVRPIGSTPTAFVESVENVRRLKQDHVRDRCEIDLSDGRRLAFGFHLFTAVELRNHFSGCFDIEDLRGLDLFHCRFTPDSRWNPVR